MGVRQSQPTSRVTSRRGRLNQATARHDESRRATLRSLSRQSHYAISVFYSSGSLLGLGISFGMMIRLRYLADTNKASWIRLEHIVYIRAIRVVPSEIRGKLPGEYLEALDTAVCRISHFGIPSSLIDNPARQFSGLTISSKRLAIHASSTAEHSAL